MTRNRKFFLLLSLALLLPILAGTLLAATTKDEADGDSFFKYLTVFTEVLTRIRENYVDVTDPSALLAGALDGATDALDPFSLYVPADAVQTYLNARELVPRHTGLVLLRQVGVLYVAGVADGSPAAKGGVQMGDIVAEIAGQSTRVMPLWQAEQLLAQPLPAKVDLKVVRLGEMKSVSLALASFELPAAELSEQQGIGILRLGAFGPATVTQVEKQLKSAHSAGYHSLVVDLRGATGGDAEAAFAVAGLLVRGELGSLKRRDETVQTFSSGKAPLWEGRLAVLTDRGTLGAAEVLATVLRQKAGAQLVGERTFGYAGKQDVATLSTGGRLFYTSAFFAGPDGKAVRESLLPDVRVDAFDGPEASEAKSDRILGRALELLASDPAALKKAA